MMLSFLVIINFSLRNPANRRRATSTMTRFQRCSNGEFSFCPKAEQNSQLQMIKISSDFDAKIHVANERVQPRKRNERCWLSEFPWIRAFGVTSGSFSLNKNQPADAHFTSPQDRHASHVAHRQSRWSSGR